MIANHEKRWLYIGIPRTGSTALHSHLQALGGVELGEQHDVNVPDELRGYTLFGTAMNPFRRAVSLFYLFGRDAEKGVDWVREFPASAGSNFESFVRDVLECTELINPVYQYSISSWMERGRLGAELHLIPVENLSAGLEALGVTPPGDKIPKRNKSRLGRWQDQYATGLEARVLHWAKDDFAKLDYPSHIEFETDNEELSAPKRSRFFPWRRRA